MHRRHKHDIIIILAVAALCVSVYLSIAKALSLNVPCDFTGGCETVLNSKYSEILGLPLSGWGMVYFSAIVIFGLLANHYKHARRLLTALLAVGSVGSLIFLSLQFFVIKAVCQYCLVTDSLTILMLLLDINIEHRRLGEPLQDI